MCTEVSAHTDASGPSRAAPGAHTSTQAPQLEKVGFLSKASVAATTTQPATEAGDTVHESELLLPAAATTMIPRASKLLTCDGVGGGTGMTKCSLSESVVCARQMRGVGGGHQAGVPGVTHRGVE